MSYSKNVKKELCSLNGKLKNCCGYSFLYGLLFCSSINGETIEKKEQFIKRLFFILNKMFSIL